jgi:hypothetical protein
MQALADAGWTVRHVVDHADWAGAGARIWLGCVGAGAQASEDSSASTG